MDCPGRATYHRRGRYHLARGGITMVKQETPNGMRCLRGVRLEGEVNALSARMTERGKRHDEHVTLLNGRIDDMGMHQDRTDEKLQELEVSQARAGARLAALVTAAVFGATILARFLFNV